MTDLVNDLLDSLQRYDITMSSWLALREDLPHDGYNRAAVPIDDLDRAINSYVSEQTIALRSKNGSVEIDADIARLGGEALTNIMIRAGRLSPNPLVDSLIVYAAHLAAGTSTGERAWTDVAETVVIYAIRVNEKELAR